MWSPYLINKAALASLVCGLLVAPTSGCLPSISGDEVNVSEDSTSLEGSFQRLKDSHGSSTLGSVISESGIPVGDWERMYTFYSPVDGDDIDSALGTDTNWSGLPGDSDSAVQVFVGGGDVRYAFIDNHPRYGVGRNRYATPESLVRAVLDEQQTPLGKTTAWVIDIEEFG
ncbi:hypothetical protein [Nocardia cyriacigeorgica]|uniref:Lipoprotein n=1 Tax=Nocardia cyriacigeorgica TaxID=135487 RepID=A0A5R8NRX6_9NOCA|nr:hypothetical protein [Nocardia cyriacigeorgica]TLF78361.1 hypothetical protein FEK34_10910 [Nocardia cyriacigeorgica]